MKRISMIIPVYNAEKYLAPLVESIQTQGWENLQIIFSEDGSEDRSPEIIRALQQKDPRILLVTGPNIGVSAARNRALAVADGDYIGFADADDILLPGYLHGLAGLLEDYDADVACCGFLRTYAASGVQDHLPVREMEPMVTDRDGFFRWMLLPEGYTTVMWNKLFRREALLDDGGDFLRFDETIHIVEDGEYLFRSRVERAVFTSQPFYHYTARTSGAMYGRITPRKLTELDARGKIVTHAENAAEDVQALAKMKYQKGVRDLFFHAVIDGDGGMIRGKRGELRRYRRELYGSPALGKKDKLKYRIYRPIIDLNLRRTGAFLMSRFGGH